MSKAFSLAALVAALVIPSVASCQGKSDQQAAVAPKAPVTHRISDRFSVIDNGDRVTWIIVPANSATPDTTVFILKGDSAVALHRGNSVPVSAATAARVKAMRDQLRGMDEMDKEISKISR